MHVENVTPLRVPSVSGEENRQQITINPNRYPDLGRRFSLAPNPPSDIANTREMSPPPTSPAPSITQTLFCLLFFCPVQPERWPSHTFPCKSHTVAEKRREEKKLRCGVCLFYIAEKGSSPNIFFNFSSYPPMKGYSSGSLSEPSSMFHGRAHAVSTGIRGCVERKEEIFWRLHMYLWRKLVLGFAFAKLLSFILLPSNTLSFVGMLSLLFAFFVILIPFSFFLGIVAGVVAFILLEWTQLFGYRVVTNERACIVVPGYSSIIVLFALLLFSIIHHHISILAIAVHLFSHLLG